MVTMYFPPCAAVAVHRMIGLARYLPRYGWNPIVVAPPNPPHEPSDPALTKLIPRETTTLISVPFAEGYWGKINRRFFPDKLWFRHARQACAQAIREHRPDAVYTTLPPYGLHRLGLSLKREFGLPWVACFRDPWAVLRQDVPSQPWKWLDARDERKTMELADLIVGISPRYSDGLRSAYSDHADKIVTITNGYDPDSFAENLTPPPRERLSILYTGELYFGRDPRPFLDALQQLDETPELPKLGFHFIGRCSPEQCDLPAEVKSRGLEHAVKLDGLIPYKDCLRTSMQADILLLIHTPGYAHGLPAKIFEYLGAHRPVLVLADHPGDIAWVLKESGTLHRIAPLADVAKIKQAIVELVRELKAGTPIAPADRDVMPFTRQDMARQFAERMDALMPSSRPSAARLVHA